MNSLILRERESDRLLLNWSFLQKKCFMSKSFHPVRPGEPSSENVRIFAPNISVSRCHILSRKRQPRRTAVDFVNSREFVEFQLPHYVFDVKPQLGDGGLSQEKCRVHLKHRSDHIVGFIFYLGNSSETIAPVLESRAALESPRK